MVMEVAPSLIDKATESVPKIVGLGTSTLDTIGTSEIGGTFILMVLIVMAFGIVVYGIKKVKHL